ncbi:MAG: type II toxin-antitoxin system VapC family toxin [Phenylobacterium sp.]|uniref:type II toxin-antitoxin system VapC family toxin n=1 Tax=Phenylobacterium sp. TaxID=1871053 RepID=UPI002715E13A|nr:type II toxin-antitoxin system VapC family toxin [Phenylobacterium sp.]MDO8913792.1 type II toxin-antitoxin system VapC family toxin [Phenylobacterium sp.]MDO9247761.1 type II toxin-antitoxin system VapC family toxin [Phenylobacterium sp.]MDP2008882.1 type II toxin-antitoxin system VapC family toxin [Phenylobacterium sp.]MDP3100525.1 type II toxin-antitoxin system VapC family toxin [Phenylobacterium sp.]MDP3635670.1 type II toxin-antitoxin system VapC family toxin [Phenylobacterium sp.]
MSAYLDASVLVALFTEDPFSQQAGDLLARQPIVLVSDYAGAELSSTLARLTRTRELTVENARAACATFDIWLERSATKVETAPADIALAQTYLRRFDLTLRAPDALHIAIAARCRTPIATFDSGMARCAEILGVELV